MGRSITASDLPHPEPVPARPILAVPHDPDAPATQLVLAGVNLLASRRPHDPLLGPAAEPHRPPEQRPVQFRLLGWPRKSCHCCFGSCSISEQ